VIKSALLRNPRERTFEALYRRHVKDIYRYALALLDRQADAEDATQTTFMNAYRALERGEHPRDSGKWLRAIALNVCREHYRRAGRRPDEVPLDEDPGDLVLDPPAPEIGDVIRGLSCLPFNQRAALVMREFEGRSMAEIGAELEVSPSAVEALLFRARRALREQLEGTLTCSDAEQAISRQLDGALPRSDRGPLRAHLRECGECASLARRLRAQRSAIRSLAALIPLPATLKLSKLAGSGVAPASTVTLGGSLAGKIAVATVAGVAALGAGYASLHRHGSHAARAAHQLSRSEARGATVPSVPAAARPSTSRTSRIATARRVSSHRGDQSRGRGSASTTARHSHGRSRAGSSQQGALLHDGTGHGRSGLHGSGSASPRHGRSSPGRGRSSAGADHAKPHPSRRSGHAYGRPKPKKSKPQPAVKPKPRRSTTHSSAGMPSGVANNGHHPK
jgi:RNA polymerase sigma factor (sigma-70 family)